MWPFRKQKAPGTEITGAQPPDDVRALSFLKPEEVAAMGGLRTEAIFGFMTGEGFSLEGFRPNPVFIKFMHEVIKRVGPENVSMQEEAKRQGDGWQYIIDLRTPDGPEGRVPLEDIVGAFEVKNGEILRDSYWANDKHLVFSASGLVQLPQPLHDALVEAIRSLGRLN